MTDQVENNGFVLPRSGYQTISKILHAYAYSRGMDATLDDVANKAGLDRTMVSSNHGFLTSLGLIAGGKKKKLTEIGSHLSLAISNEIEADIALRWGQALESNPKTRDILHMVRVQKGLPEVELSAKIRQILGLPNDKAKTSGVNCLIEIMRTSGLLVERDGKYLFTKDTSTTPNVKNEAPEQHSAATTPPLIPPADVSLPVPHKTVPTVHIDVQIHISADAKGEQIDQIFASMAKHLYGKV